MSTSAEQIAANRIGPILGEVANISVGVSSAATQLSAVLSNVSHGDYFTLKAVGGGVWFAFAADGTGSVDPTSPATADRGFYLADGHSEDFRIPRIGGVLYEYIEHITTDASATLLVFRSSTEEH